MPTTPTTPQGASLAPPSSSSPPSQESSGRNELTVPGSSGGGGGDGASSARASIISESTAPPSELVCLPSLVLKARHLHVHVYVTGSALFMVEIFNLIVAVREQNMRNYGLQIKSSVYWTLNPD